MITLFDNYGITDWDICKDEPQINLGKYLGNNQIDVASLYPKHFEILTTNPYWSKHPILENYRKYESEQWKEEKEKNMNYKFTCEEVRCTLKSIASCRNVKVMTELHPLSRKVEAVFYDPDQLYKTRAYILVLDELKCGWDLEIDRDIRLTFGKDIGHGGFTYIDTDIAFKEYCKEDILITRAINKAMRDSTYGPKGEHKPTYVSHRIPKIKDVRFNGPATIVFWSDDTKTIVKAQNEEFDPEKGIAMAIARKALGNKHGYFDVIEKYAKRYYKEKNNEKNNKK